MVSICENAKDAHLTLSGKTEIINVDSDYPGDKEFDAFYKFLVKLMRNPLQL